MIFLEVPFSFKYYIILFYLITQKIFSFNETKVLVDLVLMILLAGCTHKSEGMTDPPRLTEGMVTVMAA
jgi:hypothetical protein